MLLYHNSHVYAGSWGALRSIIVCRNLSVFEVGEVRPRFLSWKLGAVAATKTLPALVYFAGDKNCDGRCTSVCTSVEINNEKILDRRIGLIVFCGWRATTVSVGVQNGGHIN